MPASLFRTISALTLSLCLLIGLTTSTSMAADLQITALVAARPEHFQVNVTSNAASSTVNTGQIITFTLNYGSYISTQTDSVALIVNWQQSPLSPHILQYIQNSATPAIQGSQPQINLAQQTITWYISLMPPGTGRTVTWQLSVDPQGLANQHIDLAITTSLTSSGTQLVSQPLRYTYKPSAKPATTPTLISTPSPTGNQPASPIDPTITPQPTHTAPSPSTHGPTITEVGWLSLLVGLLLIGLISWIIHRKFILQLWLFWRRQTLTFGEAIINGQLMGQATVQVYQTDQQREGAIKSTTTDQFGRYQLRLQPGHYDIAVALNDSPDQPIWKQPLTISHILRGQCLEVPIKGRIQNDGTINKPSPTHEETSP